MNGIKHYLLILGFLHVALISKSADFYWIGGTGSWSDVNNWSATSGGVVPIGTVPTAADNVIFDALSGLASAADIVTMDVAVVVTDFDFSLVANSFTLASALASIEIQGDLSANGLANITWAGDIFMNPSAGGKTILSNGTTWANDVHTNGITAIILSDDFISVNDVYVNDGGLTATGINFTCQDFYSNTVNTRTIDFSNSIISINGTNWTIDNTTLTFDAVPSTIHLLNGAVVSFIGGSLAYDSLRSSAATLEIFDDNSFVLAELLTSSQLTLENGSAQQIDSLITDGACGASTTINSVNPLLASASIEKIGYSVLNGSNLSLNNVDAVISGGQSYFIALSDTTNSINWTFSGSTYYWIGNGGNWSDISHWSFNSGGPAIAGCIPGAEDSVYFDNLSFAIPNDTVIVDDESYFGYMDWSTATNNPSLRLDSTIHAYGDIVLIPNMTIRGTAKGVNFNRNSSVTSANATLDCYFLINMTDELDQLNLLDNLTIEELKGIVLQRGELHTNSFELSLGYIRVFEIPATSDLKEIQFYNSSVTIKIGFNADGVTNDFVFDAGSSHVTVGDTAYDNYIITDMPTMIFWDVTLDYSSASFSNQVVSGSAFQYNQLEILKSSHIFFDSLSTHSINDSLLIIGNCLDSIYLSSSNSAIPCSFIKVSSADVIAECIAFDGIGAGGVALSAYYSSDVGSNNPNWSIDATPPVTANFTVDGPYCFGDTTLFTDVSNLVSGLTNDYTLYWAFDDGSTTYHDLTPDSTSHVFNNGGDFDVEMIAEFSNFCTDTATISVHINEPSVYIFSDENSQIICEGTTVIFETGSFTPNTSFEFFLNGGSLNTPSPNDTLFITNSLVDQDSISVNSYENGCVTEIPAYLIFTVNDAPVFSWISSDLDTTICSADSVAFTASSADPTLNYEFSLNNVIQSNFDPSGFYWTNTILNDLDVISVVAQTAIGCMDTLDMEFTVHPLPITTLDDDIVGSVICSNDPVTFTASGANTYEFFLDGNSVLGPSTTSTWSTSTLATGEVVSVIGYSIENCEAAALETFSYTISALPNITWVFSDADTSICSGTEVTFILGGAAQYQLYINGSAQGIPQPVNSFDLSTLNDNDTVYFEGSFGACSNFSDSTIWEVFAAPTTTLTSTIPNDTICDGEEVTFTANGATNYEFFINGATQGPPSTTNQLITSSLNNNEIITVEGESNNCIVEQALTYTVLPNPSVNVFSNNPTNIICEGESITFTGANASLYELFINGSSQIGPQASPLFIPVLPAGLNSIYIIGTAPNGCSDTSATTIDVVVNPIPNVVLSSSIPNDTICSGENVIFTGTGSDMYQFFLDGISQGSMSATDTYTSSILLSGQVVHIQGSSVGCSGTSNTITTVVNSIPIVNLVSTDVDNVFCIDHSIDFNASGATNYIFTVDGIQQGPSSPVSTLNSIGFVSGTYDVEVFGESNDCNSSAALTITVNDTPISSIISSDINNTICSGDTVTYLGTGGALYEFLVNGISQGPSSIVDSILLSNLVNGDIVSVIALNANGCDDESSMAPITVSPTPNVVLSSTEFDQAICIGESVTFFGAGADEYEFFINGNSQGPASAANSFLAGSLMNGDVISLIGTSLSCPASGTDLVFAVYNYPTVTLTNNGDTSLCTNEIPDLVGSGGTTYQFLVNGIPTGPFGASATFSSALSNGDIVTVVGALNGCETTASSSYTFTVSSYPTLSSTVNPGTTICHDDIVTIDAAGASNYIFDLNGNILQTGTATSLSVSGVEDGETINVIGYNGDCPSLVDSYTFVVHSLNLNLSASPSNLICAGDNVTFTATGGDLYQFFMNGIPQSGMVPANTFSSSTLTDTDQVTFSAQSSTTGCIQAYGDYMTMFVTPEPTITALSNLNFCEGDSVILVSNLPDHNQWYLDGSVILGATDTSYSATTSGTYSLEGTSGGDGDVWSFGYNAYGNLGDGTNLDNSEPTLANTTELFDELSSGNYFVLGVTLSGEVFAWGDNEFGQLGDGTYSDESSPQIVSSLSGIKTIATTEASSAAVSNAGELYVWGNNDQGQLGTGTTSVINFPFLNTLIADVDSLAGGRNHFVILKNDGTVWTVGNNDYGQLGQNNLVGSSTPLQVTGLGNIVSIGAGMYTSFAIDDQGDLYVWGNNNSGQLGLNDLVNRLVPTLHNLKRVVSAQGGATHSIFLTSDKEVFTSGDNTYGQLGEGTTTSSVVPVQMLVDGAIQASAGEYTSLIRRSDNSVYVSGNNDLNQLSATGSTVLVPELVPDVEGVTFVEASNSSSHLIFGVGNSCSSTSVVATELSAPAVTIITSGDTLWSSAVGQSYQWYLNGVLIPSATNQFHIATVTANYYVEVTYPNGCTVTSPVFYHNMVDLFELESVGFSYYPNPTNNVLNIVFSNGEMYDADIRICDQTGRQIQRQKFVETNHLVIELSDHEPGIYYLSIDCNSQSYTIRVIKN
ncbi:MAG: T9SS type A sorting domain-containing protein [Crocinitomicaceae bacterium]|nr:T9SS type A sorting domain-containing protein [Crocinitomicaceae bacterium]